MYDYRPLAYRPRFGQAVVTTAPAVVAPAPVASPTIVPEGLLWTALASAASWAAIRTGLRAKESTLVRVAGWGGGVAAGLVALAGVAGLLAPSAARTLPVRWYWV